jgi:phosphoribosylglycinamide formyltransferase-1
MLNIAVLVSGGGTNLQALIDAEKNGILKNGHIKLVISSSVDAYALQRARNNGIDSFVLTKKEYANVDDYSDALVKKLDEYSTDLVILAGFLTIFSKKVTDAYKNKIINIHPALIPSFCGKGYYGLHVHEAVLASGVKVTGATVHFVTEECDGGPIILQKAVNVLDDDTPETLQKRVMHEAEWKLLPEAASLFCQGRLIIDGKKVHIKEEM